MKDQKIKNFKEQCEKGRVVKWLYTAFPMGFPVTPYLFPHFQVDHAAETASSVCTFSTKKFEFFPLSSVSTEHTSVLILLKPMIGRQEQPLLVGVLCFWKIRGRQHRVWAFHRDQLILPIDCLPFPPINSPNILEINCISEWRSVHRYFQLTSLNIHVTGKKLFH